MTINEYQKQAMRTLNPELDKKDVLINGVMGLCGEAGETIDLVKKHLHQGNERGNYDDIARNSDCVGDNFAKGRNNSV